MRPAWLSCLLALAVIGAALGLRALLDPWFGDRVPYITLFGGVIVCAWWTGVGPALLAAALGYVVTDYLFVPPRFGFAPYDAERVIELAAYALSCLLIVALAGAMRRARRQTGESDARFRAFMRHSPSGVFLKDEAGRYVFMNRAGEELAGTASWEGRTDHEILAPGTAAEVQAHDREVLESGVPQTYDLDIATPQGLRTFYSVKFPLQDAEGRRYVGSITTDVTAERAAARAAAEADRRKDQFLATLAHELRNPLAPIRNAAALLAVQPGLDPEVQWARSVIDRQVDQMSRLIDDLLDLARISSGKLLLRRQEVPLSAVIHLAVETSRPHIEAARHTLQLVDAAGEIWLDADATRLAQVFSNLLNNAARYTAAGGKLVLRATRGDGEATVSIEDDGRGFRPELARTLFEPFIQGDADAQPSAGLGIGLSIVRGIVELHGGSVEAHSEGPGRGSRFTVRLPALPRPAARKAPEPAAGLKPGGARILVADDNRDAADSLQKLLSLSGHDVRVAYDGVEAIRVAGEFVPRVAILDIGMPGADGYEVARALRAARGVGVGLVALTGWGQEHDRSRALEAGFDHHLTKPADTRVLEEIIGKICHV